MRPMLIHRADGPGRPRAMGRLEHLRADMRQALHEIPRPWREVAAYRDAVDRLVSWYERRTMLLEQTVLEALGRDALTETQRTETIAVLNANRKRRLVDARLLPPHESAIVEAYRALPPAAQQATRTLLLRAAGMGDGEDDERDE